MSKSDIAGLSKYGTAEVIGLNNADGGLPTRNYTSGYFEGYEPINGPTMYDTILRGAAQGQQDRLGRDTCFACAVRCKRVVEVKEGTVSGRPVLRRPGVRDRSPRWARIAA